MIGFAVVSIEKGQYEQARDFYARPAARDPQHPALVELRTRLQGMK